MFVVLSLALLAGGVAVGIHILHKQALASNTNFKVCISWLDHEDDDVDEVRIRTHNALGQVLDDVEAPWASLNTWKAEFVPNSHAVTWSAEVIPFVVIEFDEDNPQNMGGISVEGNNNCWFTEI